MHELEEIKRSIAENRSASDEDEAKLKVYFDEFRTAIKSGKPSTSESAPRPARRSEEQTEVEVGEETLDSIFDEEKTPPPPPKPRPGRLVVKVSADGLRKAAGEPDPSGRPAPVTTGGLDAIARRTKWVR